MDRTCSTDNPNRPSPLPMTTPSAVSRFSKLFTARGLACGLLAGLVLALTGCETIPETGRSRFMGFAPSVGQEAQLGAAAFAEAKKERALSTDAARTRLVQETGRRIAGIVGGELPNAQWEFILLQGDEVNAFCLPGGKVAVYEGLFQAAKSTDELAMVMGHEIAHAVKRHGAERMSNATLAALASQVTGAAVQASDLKENYKGLILAGTGFVAQGVLLKYSRDQESEADHLGLIYAARAGYDPRAAVTFWQNMSQLKGGQQPPEWLSTHPSDTTRIARLQSLMPKAMELYRNTQGIGMLLPRN
jgi:metalloendopeptidase OMA1, mitochondrial